jgi:hypothetical protein
MRIERPHLDWGRHGLPSQPLLPAVDHLVLVFPIAVFAFVWPVDCVVGYGTSLVVPAAWQGTPR